MSKPDMLRIYSLRFIFLILGLTAILPFTYFIANFSNVPFNWLMPALYISACVMLFINFYGKKHASLLRFGLRVCLTALTVFVIFPDITILAKFLAAGYMIILL